MIAKQIKQFTNYQDAADAVTPLQQAGNVTSFPHVVHDPILMIAWAVDYEPKEEWMKDHKSIESVFIASSGKAES
jgi:hypothetical protein